MNDRELNFKETEEFIFGDTMEGLMFMNELKEAIRESLGDYGKDYPEIKRRVEELKALKVK